MLQGEISTSMLIRMSNQEMASKEKIEWRQKQEKDDIDRRKKLEEERQKEVRSNILTDGLELSCCGFSKIFNFLEPILMEHKE